VNAIAIAEEHYHMGPGKRRGKRTASEVPPALIRERETFVRTVLRKGVEFTEELLRENRRYGQELSKLQTENARLRAQIASEDAIRELLITIENLEKERSSLLARSRELERTSEKYEGRYLQMEKELNDLASLYVASFQLHGTLSPSHVLEHIGDLLDQFIGAKTSVLYIIQTNGKVAQPVAWSKIDESKLKPVSVGEGSVGEVCLTGVLTIGKETFGGTIENPLAIVPLTADGKTVGVISVIELLQQKKQWEPVDEELFKLLGAHACTALIASNLYYRDGGANPLAALNGLRSKLPKKSTGFGRESAAQDNKR
jgi:hypothetical protein